MKTLDDTDMFSEYLGSEINFFLWKLLNMINCRYFSENAKTFEGQERCGFLQFSSWANATVQVGFETVYIFPDKWKEILFHVCILSLNPSFTAHQLPISDPLVITENYV